MVFDMAVFITKGQPAERLAHYHNVVILVYVEPLMIRFLVTTPTGRLPGRLPSRHGQQTLSRLGVASAEHTDAAVAG